MWDVIALGRRLAATAINSMTSRACSMSASCLCMLVTTHGIIRVHLAHQVVIKGDGYKILTLTGSEKSGMATRRTTPTCTPI